MHNKKLVIHTTESPFYAYPRRLSPEKLEKAKKGFEYMRTQGICRSFSSL